MGSGRARAGNIQRQAAPVWRAPEGTGRLRGAEPNEVRQPSLAGSRTRMGRSQPQASPDWRPPRGLQGLAGLRDDAPSEARSADGERAGRPRGGRRSGEARSADGERAGRPRGGRRSGEARSADSSRAGRRPPAHTAAGPSGARNTSTATSNAARQAGISRNYSPARRSTSCMMRPHTALTHATAATPRTRERQGRICRKSSKP